jgi:hypothetical protein
MTTGAGGGVGRVAVIVGCWRGGVWTEISGGGMKRRRRRLHLRRRRQHHLGAAAAS